MIAGRRQPAAVHALVAALNAALDNIGVTVSYGAPLLADARAGFAPITTLAQEIAAGQVDTLVITARNPAYGAPVDLKFDKLIARVPHDHLSFAVRGRDRAQSCTYFVPAAHPLETWGDGRATDGTITPHPAADRAAVGRHHRERGAGVVPGGGRSARTPCCCGPGRPGWRDRIVPGATGDPDQLWEKWLSDGAIVGTETIPAGRPDPGRWVRGPAVTGRQPPLPGALASRSSSPPTTRCSTAASPTPPGCRSCRIRSPRSTWDNAAMMSAATAKALGVEVERDGDKLSILVIETRPSHPRAGDDRSRSRRRLHHAPPRLRPQGGPNRGAAASASTPAPCAPATPPGSTAARR